MIYFLYGPDTYRSSRKLNEIIEKYKKIHKSGLNFACLDAEDSDFDEFKMAAETISMFREKKLIILKSLFKNKTFAKDFSDYIGSHSLSDDAEVILIVYEKDIPSGDKILFDVLAKKAKCQDFQLLRGSMLERWVAEQAFHCGLKIDSALVRKLIVHIGSDPWRLANELKKLSSYRGGEELQESDLILLVVPEVNPDIFKTIDAIAARDKKTALNLISRHLERGEDEFYLLSMMGYQFRNLIKIGSKLQPARNAASDAGGWADGNAKTRVDKLAGELGMHPFVVKKSLAQIKKFSIGELKNIYEKLFETDLRIKTGLVEPRLGLEMLVAGI